MSKYKICLIFLLTISHNIWGKADVCLRASADEVVPSLKLQGFSCKTRISGNCTYQECKGRIQGYSKETLVLLPSQSTCLRVHFRGHKLNPSSLLDQEPAKMINALNLGGAICSRGEALIVPDTSGKCSEYDRELTDAKAFKSFFAGIEAATGSHLQGLPLHISAHSGGGRTVARMLKAGFDPTMVTLFDGIYADDQRLEYEKWLQRSQGALNLFSVIGGSPLQHGRSILANRKESPKANAIQIKSKLYKIMKTGKIEILEKQDGPADAHYQVMTETWAVTPVLEN